MSSDRMPKLALALAILFVGSLVISVTVLARPGRVSNFEKDKQALIDLENQWLNARDRATLDRVLAPDFVHPVPEGDFLTKKQHIDWVVAHPAPQDIRRRLENLKVRIYGDTAIVNGMVITTKADGAIAKETVFTDVFIHHDGRWRAVNAQENSIPPANWQKGSGLIEEYPRKEPDELAGRPVTSYANNLEGRGSRRLRSARCIIAPSVQVKRCLCGAVRYGFNTHRAAMGRIKDGGAEAKILGLGM